MSNKHPQPAVIRDGRLFELVDQRTGKTISKHTTASAARAAAQHAWPEYRFRWDHNDEGESIGRATHKWIEVWNA